jgi:hypothetical protein
LRCRILDLITGKGLDRAFRDFGSMSALARMRTQVRHLPEVREAIALRESLEVAPAPSETLVNIVFCGGWCHALMDDVRIFCHERKIVESKFGEHALDVICCRSGSRTGG